MSEEANIPTRFNKDDMKITKEMLKKTPPPTFIAPLQVSHRQNVLDESDDDLHLHNHGNIKAPSTFKVPAKRLGSGNAADGVSSIPSSARSSISIQASSKARLSAVAIKPRGKPKPVHLTSKDVITVQKKFKTDADIYALDALLGCMHSSGEVLLSELVRVMASSSQGAPTSVGKCNEYLSFLQQQGKVVQRKGKTGNCYKIKD